MPARLAYCLIRREPPYRHTAFYDGLVAAGYQVSLHDPRYPKAGDVLVIWNRSGTFETMAKGFEAGGGTVVVVENGYVGVDEDKRMLYAMALRGHNGQGSWVAADNQRWNDLNIPIQPWRDYGAGKYILVCPNRQIGPKLMRQPGDFVDQVYALLKHNNRLPIRVRPHPGNWQVRPPAIPLSEDLREAECTVIWSSSAGVHSLIAGVPVVCMAPEWICKLATSNHPSHTIRNDVLRRTSLEKLAWAQWTVREIQSGKAFRWLLSLQ